MLLFPETGVAAPKEPWRELLRHAAGVLETQGWTAGAYENEGLHCAVGAMNAVLGREVMETDFGHSRVFDEAYLRLAQYIRAAENDPDYVKSDDVDDYEDVVQDWNDGHSPSEGEAVIKTLREVADVA